MTIPKGSFGISFGGLQDSLETQLNKQGLTLSNETDLIQDCADAITTLYICGYLTETETDKARTRLFKDIKRKVKPLKA